MIAAIADSEKSYVARSTMGNVRGLKKVLKTALENVANGGFSFVEVLSVCPNNWRTNNVKTLERLKQMEEFFEVKEFMTPAKKEEV